MTRISPSLLVLAAALAVAAPGIGCGGRVPHPAADAGPSLDAGDSGDAGDVTDAGSIDAGTPDAGASAPHVITISITPAGQTPCDVLTCQANTENASTVTYAWTIDGIAAASTTNHLDGVTLASGALVRCIATPHRDSVDGDASTSAPFTATESALLDSDADGTCDATDACFGTGMDSDLDGVCDSSDPCPASPHDDSDHNGVCDDADLCNALSELSIQPLIRAPGDAITATPGTFPASILDAATLTWSWSVDGLPSSITSPLVPAGTTKVEEVWSVAVSADFLDLSTCFAGATASFVTNLPRCTAASLSPADPTTADALTCACTAYSDRDGDPEGASICVFKLPDGTVLSAGDAPACTLPAHVASKGQTVSCTYIPVDEDGAGYVTAKSSNTLVNSPPTAPRLTIGTAGDVAIHAQDLTTPITCSPAIDIDDADGDALTYTLTWSINDAEVLGTTGSAVGTTTLTSLFAALATPRAPVHGDQIGCTLVVSDGTATVTLLADALAIANNVPTITAIHVEDASVGEQFHCGTVVSDLDGDTLELFYAWERVGTVSGISGTLPGTGEYLLNDSVPVGDQVICTATVSDGIDWSQRASNKAKSADAGPTGAVTLTSTAKNGRAPSADDTLSCILTNLRDPEGDEFTTRYTWYVNDDIEQSEVKAVGAISTFSGKFKKNDVVKCEGIVSDGMRGHLYESSVTIGNQIPGCQATVTNRFMGNDDAITCGCASNASLDKDGDIVSTACQWTTNYGGAVVSNNCTVTGTQTPNDSMLKCTVTVTDTSGESGKGEATAYTGGTNHTTWTNPGVTLSPASGLTVWDLDSTLTCAWNRTATSTSGRTPTYFVRWWLGNSNNVIAEYERATVKLRDLTTSPAVGQQIQCEVYAFDGQIFEETYAGSNWITVSDAPAAPRSVVSTPTGYVKPGETFKCDLTLSPNAPGSLGVNVGVQLSTDSTKTNWNVLAAKTGGPSTAKTISITVPTDAAGKWLRCYSSTYETSILRVYSDWVYVIATPPTITNVEAVPAVSTPCEKRYCQVMLADADAALGYDVDVHIDVNWYIDGVKASFTDYYDYRDLGTNAQALRVPMNATGLANGSKVTCQATVTKTGLAGVVSAVSAPALVTGLMPTVTSATVPSFARADDGLTCTATIANACPNADLDMHYTWLANGGTTSDSGQSVSGFSAGDSVQCTASVGVAGGGYSSPVTSNSAFIGPSEWYIVGFDANTYAGASVAVVGDLNGDGYPELALGAPNATAYNRTSAGKVYVVPGSFTNNGMYLTPLDAGEQGRVLLGDSGSWAPTESICRVKSSNIIVPCVPGMAGLSHQGEGYGPLGDGLGTAMVAPGDVDGDGVADLVVSAPYAFAHGQYLAGRTYVLGGTVLNNTQVSLVGSAITNGLGAAYDGEQGVWQSKLYTTGGINQSWNGHNAGYGLAAGDFDGDGVPDLALGAPYSDTSAGSDSGRTYVLPLGAGLAGGWLGTITGTTDLTGSGTNATVPGWTLDGRTQVSYQKGYVGAHLSNVGDFDGDGLDDLFVADDGWENVNYLVPGRASGSNTVLSAASSTLVRKIDPGSLAFNIAASPVHPLDSTISGKHDLYSRGAGVGDVNGDGKADLAIPWIERENGTAQIELAIFFGSTGGDLDVNGPDQGVGGFVVEGRPGGSDIKDTLRVFAAGDVDGDGLDDIALALVRDSAIVENRLYIVYGKRDTTSLTFSQLESGVGGFLMDTVAPVRSVSSGDIDGDGLSDLLIGMPTFSAVKSNAGVAQIWYGRPRSGTTLLRGLNTNDTLTGTTGADRIIGGPGNDLIQGNGGADVLSGGSGNDTLVVNDATFVRVRGGYGTDTLRVNGFDLDLSATRGLITSIEKIDLASGSLRIAAVDLLHLSETSNDLVVTGSSGATVRVTDAGWVMGGTTTVDGLTMTALTKGKARLFVQLGLNLMVAPRLVTTSFTVSEAATGGSAIGVPVAEDADGDAVTFTADLTGLTGLLEFQTNPPLLKLATGATLDFETKPTIQVPITSTDTDGLSTTATVTVYVTDAPEAPTFTVTGTSTTVGEGPTNGTTIAIVRATDPDAGDVVTYSWVSERQWTGATTFTDNRHAFTVNATTGRVTVLDGTYLDYEFAPLVDLVIRATDSTGRTDDITVHVTVTDRTTLAQTITMPFLAENRGVWDADGSISTSAVNGPLSTLDLGTTMENGDVALVSPVGDQSYPMSGSISGTFGISADMKFSDGYLSAYLPIAVTTELPDNVTLGVPFDIDTNWSLADDATVWGETPGISASVNFNFGNIAANLQNSLFPSQPSAVLNQNGLKLGFTVTPQKFGGGKFDTYYPSGLDLISPASTGSGYGNWTFPASISSSTHSTEEKVLGGLLLGANATSQGYTNPDLVISGFAQDKFLETDLTLTGLLKALGLPGAQYNMWQGTFSVPMGWGRFDVKYDIWSSRFSSSALYQNWFAVEVEDVMATITFENGTKFTRPLRTGFKGITVPAGEDVNGDGRVTFEIAVTIDTKMHRFWNYNVILTYLSNMLGGSSLVYAKDIDYITGTVLPTVSLVQSNSFGPIRHTEMSISPVRDSGTPSWTLKGFETIRATGALQLAAAP